MESLITYFGYGSLVNRATRPAEEPSTPATLHGWQRAWAHRGDRGRCCSLTIKAADAPISISGVVVTMARSELPILDAREAGYDRHMLPAAAFDLPDNCMASEIAVYVSKAEQHFPACEQYPILQSYVDCVMAGYLGLFGEAGLSAFMQTTEGWHRPIADDRAAPRYPRAVTLSQGMHDRFSELIDHHRVID